MEPPCRWKLREASLLALGTLAAHCSKEGKAAQAFRSRSQSLVDNVLSHDLVRARAGVREGGREQGLVREGAGPGACACVREQDLVREEAGLSA